MDTLLNDLNWRYATKKFDSSKKVADTTIELLKKVLQLVPTSYGLQPLKHLFIENPSIRKELFNHSFGQYSIIEASHLIVICSYTKVLDENVDTYIKNMSIIRQQEEEKIIPFGYHIKNKMREWGTERQAEWTSKQAYIALGFLLQACASLHIDSTPMEGFDPIGYGNVLNLNDKNLAATLVVPIGYRHSEDNNQYLKKVRRTPEELFEIV